jgi:hypothetical protein
MCKKFQKSWPHKLWDYNIWSGKKSFFPLYPTWTIDFDRLWYKKIQLRNSGVLHHCNAHHIRYLLPNLRSRWWVEHTQVHLILKKGTKKFHNTSNSYGIFGEFTFSQEFQWSKCTLILANFFGKQWNLQAPWGMEDFTLPSVGESFKKWECCTPILPKCQGHLHNTKKKR